MIATVFPHRDDAKHPHYKEVSTILEWIRRGGSFSGKDLEEEIGKIRSLPKKQDRDELKRWLLSICWSGRFTHRSNDGLINGGHSGIICLDWDHLGEQKDNTKKRFSNDKYVHAVFDSPSGDGLKVLVKIPPSPETHLQSYYALRDYFSDMEVDKLDDLKDVARICYISFDSDLYHNPASEVFTKLSDKVKQVNSETAGTVDHVPVDNDKIVDRGVKLLTEDGMVYAKGNRHRYLVKLAGFCNACGLSSLKAFQIFKSRFIVPDHEEPVTAEKIETIISDVYSRYRGQYNTLAYSEGKIAYKATGKEFSIKDVSKDLLIRLEDVQDALNSNFRNGINQGETTHFVSLDEVFRWKRGELTVLHGIGNMGKSTFLMHLLIIKSVLDGYKYAIFTPEQFPPEDFYDDLVHCYLGRNTKKRYKDQVSLEEYQRGCRFINDHFFYVNTFDTEPTPEVIRMAFLDAIEKHGVDGVVVDPYNMMDHSISMYGGREDLYLSNFLTKFKHFAQTHSVFLVIVTHPKSMTNKNKDANGNYTEPPDIFDIAGGAQWNNKADNILVVHRPYRRNNSPEANMVLFESQKIRQQLRNGRPGQVMMSFDYKTYRFYERDQKHPLIGKTEAPDNELFNEADEYADYVRGL